MGRLELIQTLMAHGVPDEIITEVMKLQTMASILEERRKNDRNRQQMSRLHRMTAGACS